LAIISRLCEKAKIWLKKLAAKCYIEHSDITRYEKGEIT
jgi:hypothetical protein